MKTVFPYKEQIPFAPYLEGYFQRTDSDVTVFTALPREAEVRELARKSVVKDQMTLVRVPEDEPAALGDTLTLRTASELPKFNKEKVTVTIGRGLYDRGLEEALAGKRRGESAQAVVREKTVTAEVLEIRRRQAPEPTDEMTEALQVRDFDNQLIRTFAAYEAFLYRQKTMEVLSTVNYYVIQAIMADYPIADFHEEDIRVLGELEKAYFHRMTLEREGVDLFRLSKEEMQERMHCDSMDDFIAMRYEWYKIKIHQCLVYLNLLGLPCQGKTDPLDHYEVLSELQDKMFDKIKAELMRRNGE